MKYYSRRVQCLSETFSNRRLDQEEEFFPEFENNSFEITHSEEQKGKRKKEIM